MPRPIPSTGAGRSAGYDPGDGAAGAIRSARERRRALGERAPACGRAFGAGGRAQARDIADPAAPHGRSALSAVAALACASRDGVRLRPDGRVHEEGRRTERSTRAEERNEVGIQAEEGRGREAARYRVRVTFESPRGRSTSRPRRRARDSATSCATTAKLIGVSASDSGARSSTASSASSAVPSSFVTT